MSYFAVYQIREQVKALRDEADDDDLRNLYGAVVSLLNTVLYVLRRKAAPPPAGKRLTDDRTD